MTQPNDLSQVVREMRLAADLLDSMGSVGPASVASRTRAWADRLESAPTPAEDHGADALAWMRAQAKALGMTNADTEVPLYLARCLASHITFPTPAAIDATPKCDDCQHRPCICMVVNDEPAPTPAEARGEVQRWFAPLYGNQPGHAYTSGTGQFVKYDDYATLARQLAEANERADKFMWQVRDTCRRAEQAEAQLAQAKAELHKRTDSVIVASGLALACSVVVKEAFDLQQAQLAQATARLAAVEKLAEKWRDATSMRVADCGDELLATLNKEPTHAPE